MVKNIIKRFFYYKAKKHIKQDKVIYEMELHEKKTIYGKGVDVIRVAGGWIYKFYFYKNNDIVFVPFSDEFQGGKKW